MVGYFVEPINYIVRFLTVVTAQTVIISRTRLEHEFHQFVIRDIHDHGVLFPFFSCPVDLCTPNIVFADLYLLFTVLKNDCFLVFGLFGYIFIIFA